MRTVSSTLLSSYRASSKTLAVVVEFYKNDAVPTSSGFDPAGSDFLLGISLTDNNVTFRGQTYQRLIAKDGIGQISKTLNKTLSGFSITLSNSTRDIIQFEQLYGFEGLICIVRALDWVNSATLVDSDILFTGRCDPPDEFDKSSETCTISISQILNQTETIAPRRKFTTNDPIGRAQSDPLFEGFVYTQRGGSLEIPTKEPKGGFFGFLLGLKKTVIRTQSYTSHSDLQEETCVPLVLGRTQAQLITFAYIDQGIYIDGVGFWCDGHEYGISDVQNVRSVTNGMDVGPIAVRLGLPGALTSDSTHQSNDEPTWIAAGAYSRTAYMRFVAHGTTLESDDPAPVIVAMLFGQLLPTPDSSGNFNVIDFSDNAVCHSRWLMNSVYYFNLPDAWHDDAENFKAFNYCNQILVDQNNTDTVLLDDSQTGIAGTDYNIYKPTGTLSPIYYKYQLGTADAADAAGIEADYNFYSGIPVNSDDWAGTGVSSLPPTAYRRRYTCNFQLLEETKAIDLDYDVILQSSNLYLVQTSTGKIAHRVKKPADFTFIYGSSSVGDTEIHLKNINPWIGSTDLILIGANLSTSEVRRITGYRYDTSVSLSISASGGVSGSASTLSGGSSTVAPNATLTVSSTSGTKSITIAGFTLTYSSQSGETTSTCAGMIAGMINSHNELNKFIKAAWNNNTTVTVSSRIGYLSLDSALSYAHLASIANPTGAPGLTSVSGSLAAGVYQVSYAYVTQEGDSLTSPVTSITLTANRNIQTPSITKPSRVLAIKWYISTEPGGVRRKLIKINDGSSFVINALPLADDELEPVLNETAEEIHAIALSFTDKANTQANLTRSNMLKGTFKFPMGGREQSTNQIKLKYRDAAADYKLTTLIVNDYVKQAKSKKVTPLEINGAGIDNENQARRIANSLIAEKSDGNRFLGWSTNGEALLLEEGDVVCITDESGQYVNEPVRIEEITIDNNSGYPFASFVARKYRRYFYDDQVQERLVPLPIVQNDVINTEQTAPVISAVGDRTLTTAYIKVEGYSDKAKFRKIVASSASDMSAVIGTTIIDGTTLPNQQLSAIEVVTKVGSTDPTYYQISHSSNGINYGDVSNILTITFADDSGDGVPILLPEGDGLLFGRAQVSLFAGIWLFRLPEAAANNYGGTFLEIRMYNTNHGVVSTANYSTSAASITFADASNLGAAGKLISVETDETVAYTNKSGNTVTGCTRGVDGSTPGAINNGDYLYPIEIQESLGYVQSWQLKQTSNDYYIMYRRRNNVGWSEWSYPVYCAGSSAGTQPPAPIPPPPVDPAPPDGYQDPFDPIYVEPIFGHGDY